MTNPEVKTKELEPKSTLYLDWESSHQQVGEGLDLLKQNFLKRNAEFASIYTPHKEPNIAAFFKGLQPNNKNNFIGIPTIVPVPFNLSCLTSNTEEGATLLLQASELLFSIGAVFEPYLRQHYPKAFRAHRELLAVIQYMSHDRKALLGIRYTSTQMVEDTPVETFAVDHLSFTTGDFCAQKLPAEIIQDAEHSLNNSGQDL